MKRKFKEFVYHPERETLTQERNIRALRHYLKQAEFTATKIVNDSQRQIDHERGVSMSASTLKAQEAGRRYRLAAIISKTVAELWNLIHEMPDVNWENVILNKHQMALLKKGTTIRIKKQHEKY